MFQPLKSSVVDTEYLIYQHRTKNAFCLQSNLFMKKMQYAWYQKWSAIQFSGLFCTDNAKQKAVAVSTFLLRAMGENPIRHFFSETN